RVPDTQLLAQFRVKGLQEGLVEVLHSVVFLEALKEEVSVHAVERCLSPVQDFDEVQRTEAGRRGHLVKQGADHWYAQIPRGVVPIEDAFSFRSTFPCTTAPTRRTRRRRASVRAWSGRSGLPCLLRIGGPAPAPTP